MTGFLSALGTGMLGAVGGAADSFAGSLDKKIDRQARMDDMQSIEQFKEKMQVEREARLKAAKIEENKAVMGRAGEMANAERGTQMDQAAEIYRKSGMSEEDIALGIGATETARAEKVAPSRANITAAMSEGGFLNGGQIVADMDKQEQTDFTRSTAAAKTEYDQGRDAVGDARNDRTDKRLQTNSDRSYALDKQRLGISAAAANAAASDRSVAKSDKAALKAAYAEYGAALIAESRTPGVTGQAIPDLKAAIVSLNGSPENMDNALLGKMTTGEVTTKLGDPTDEGGEKSTKSKVNLGRSGGALQPNSNNGPKPTPRAEYDRMPAGATYTGPDGKQYRKGK